MRAKCRRPPPDDRARLPEPRSGSYDWADAPVAADSVMAKASSIVAASGVDVVADGALKAAAGGSATTPNVGGAWQARVMSFSCAAWANDIGPRRMIGKAASPNGPFTSTKGC